MNNFWPSVRPNMELMLSKSKKTKEKIDLKIRNLGSAIWIRVYDSTL
jgi:hypothetical protein